MRKIMSIISTAVLSTIILTNVAVAAANIEHHTNHPMRIFINGEQQQFDVEPILERGTTLVPMRTMFELLKAEVKWNEETKTVTASKEDIEIKVKLDSYFSEVNGETIKLAVKPRIVEGRTMVPLRFISEALGSKVEWDPSTREIAISTNFNQETENNVEKNNGEDVNEDKLTLNYEQAVEWALKNSLTLKNAKENIKRAEELRNQASENVKYTPIGTGYTPEEAAATNALLGLTQANTQWEMAKKQLEITEESIGFQVKSAYTDILTKGNEIFIADRGIEHAEAQLELMTVKVENGAESEFNLINERNILNEERQKRKKLLQELDDSYLTLNKILGKTENEHYSLVNETKLEWLNDVDLESHVNKIIQDNPKIWLKEQEIKMKEMGIELYVFNVGAEPYKVKELDVQTAKNELAEMKDNMEKDIKSRYNQMNQIETQYEILETNLEKAKHVLNLVRTQYDAGMAIDFQLKEAELAVTLLESEKLNLALGYDQLKTLFYKPWIGI